MECERCGEDAEYGCVCSHQIPHRFEKLKQQLAEARRQGAIDALSVLAKELKEKEIEMRDMGGSFNPNTVYGMEIGYRNSAQKAVDMLARYEEKTE